MNLLKKPECSTTCAVCTQESTCTVGREDEPGCRICGEPIAPIVPAQKARLCFDHYHRIRPIGRLVEDFNRLDWRLMDFKISEEMDLSPEIRKKLFLLQMEVHDKIGDCLTLLMQESKRINEE